MVPVVDQVQVLAHAATPQAAQRAIVGRPAASRSARDQKAAALAARIADSTAIRAATAPTAIAARQVDPHKAVGRKGKATITRPMVIRLTVTRVQAARAVRVRKDPVVLKVKAAIARTAPGDRKAKAEIVLRARADHKAKAAPAVDVRQDAAATVAAIADYSLYNSEKPPYGGFFSTLRMEKLHRQVKFICIHPCRKAFAMGAQCNWIESNDDHLLLAAQFHQGLA
jgi:hypothetical protein